MKIVFILISNSESIILSNCHFFHILLIGQSFYYHAKFYETQSVCENRKIFSFTIKANEISLKTIKVCLNISFSINPTFFLNLTLYLLARKVQILQLHIVYIVYTYC